MRCLVLCAGKGERLMPLTAKTPKPLVLVNGKPILEYTLENLLKHGIKDIIVNLNYRPVQIMEKFGDRVIFSFEKERLGTAGAIKKVGDWLDSPFLVVNGDTITNVDITAMIEYHKKTNSCLTVFTKYGSIHNGGTFIFDKGFLDEIPENKPYSIHEDLIPNTRRPITLYFGKDTEYYYDIGTPEKLANAEEKLK